MHQWRLSHFWRLQGDCIYIYICIYFQTYTHEIISVSCLIKLCLNVLTTFSWIPNCKENQIRFNLTKPIGRFICMCLYIAIVKKIMRAEQSLNVASSASPWFCPVILSGLALHRVNLQIRGGFSKLTFFYGESGSFRHRKTWEPGSDVLSDAVIG